MFFKKKAQTDEIFIQNILAGGKTAQLAEKKLFNQFTGLIVKGQREHELSKDEAYDAYAEAVLTVFQHIRSKKFKGKSSLKTYLNRIFNNKCIDLFRKKTTNKSRVHYWTDDLTAISNHQAHQNVQKYLEDQELITQLEKSLQKLGKVCKQIILEYAYGFSFEEIAARLNPPFKNGTTVKSKKSQCMKKLKVVL